MPARFSISLAIMMTSLCASAAPVDYATAVKPILARHCYKCHGPEEQKGGLGLASMEAVMKGGKSGNPAVVAHDADGSPLMQRVTATDPDDRMPPKGDPLDAESIAILKTWIAEGADFGDAEAGGVAANHWAFDAPVQAALPEVAGTANPIDAFIQARLATEGLTPSPEADRHTLARRLYLDLTGLPPSPEEVAAFVSDERPDAYALLVDSLLASPHYGERRAMRWLDIAHYADTNGYEKDRYRSIWPYRDWVINAFNDDMPFDEFVVKQLAGDLLPRATEPDHVATGFLRNSLYNEEGGVDVEEFRFEAMIDRTNTTAEAFFGLTMGCAQCHDHKYDPISQKEYYRFFAFLNNTDNVEYTLHDPEIADTRAKVERKIARLEVRLPSRFPLDENDAAKDVDRTTRLKEHFEAWRAATREKAAPWTVLEPLTMESKNGATMSALDDGSVLVSGDYPNTDTYTVTFRTEMRGITGLRLEVLPDETLPGGGPGRGVIMSDPGDFLLSEFGVTFSPWSWPEAILKPDIAKATADFAPEGREIARTIDAQIDTGWSITGQQGKPHQAVYAFAEPVAIEGGALVTLRIEQFFVHQHTLGRFRVSATTKTMPEATGLPADLEAALLADEAGDSPELLAYYLNMAPELEEARAEIAALRKQMPAFPTTLALQERANARVTHVYHRGEYLQPADPVAPGTPAVLHDFPAYAAQNRLAFARWIASEENPLLARVTVNRLWGEIFGKGLVETTEDFGVMGSPPSHPELLDWLAVEFMRRGWRVKELARLIVLSDTYKQSAVATDELLQRDPTNVLLARGARFRVDAEMVRDIALASSGLLSADIGGPSVYPPLTKGLMDGVYGGAGNAWPESRNGDQFRRGLYTYWKRILPYPSQTVFDQPPRDTVCTRRIRSNTPLQALTLLNNDAFLEAAAAMARRVLLEAPTTTEERVDYAFMLAVGRPPADDERASVLQFFNAQHARFVAGELDPAPLAALAGMPDNATWTAPDVAAWTAVCRALLNLDETISKA